MNRVTIIERARSAVGHGTIYKLGAGGFNPGAQFPWNARGECDCSGFVAWCLGLSRHTDHPWYVKQNGGWFETTAIAMDALSPFGFFDAVPLGNALPGDLLVYGDRDGHQGHVGMISRITEDGPANVVHCSLGGYKRHGDAIRETDPGVFFQHSAIVARSALIEMEA